MPVRHEPPKMIENSSHVRRSVRVTGTVQGVGFRPWVYRLAVARHLAGHVLNDSRGVVIEIEGAPTEVSDFLTTLQADRNFASGPDAPPPLARIASVQVEPLPCTGERQFDIRSSDAAQAADTQVAPDTTVCADCLAELFNPADRRFRYPFINCTNCGPRYSIVLDVPYDRSQTTMNAFRMCPACQREYDDPASRRFHAQPNACPVCGPRLMLYDAQGRQMNVPIGDAVTFARMRLLMGDIVVLKGLTGYHLACDARNEAAVATLRRRKRRDEKPLALMVADAAQAAALVRLDEPSRHLLESIERPIVLIPRRDDAAVAFGVAPRSRYLGLMLPYTPLHRLLMADGTPPLVMTSANLSEEPMCRQNHEVLSRLAQIADLYLLHNRPIQTVCDDSVAIIQCGTPLMIRRARGYAPRPIRLPAPPRESILAVGPELKNCVCLTRGDEAYVSQHIGDLKNAFAAAYFEETVDKLRRLLEVTPSVVAHDLHPAYRSTRYAMAMTGVRRVAVQHHHAHIASVCVERGLTEPVIGLAMDGTGHGTDGRTWGSEFLEVRPDGTFTRLGHLSYLALPGGDAAVEHVSRIAWSCLVDAFGAEADAIADRYLPDTTDEQRQVWRQMIAQRLNAPLACGLGRLFDAASALCGVCLRSTYEGQAAVELEAAAEGDADESLSWDVAVLPPEVPGAGTAFQIVTAPLIRDLVAAREAGQPVGRVATRFHNAVASFLLAGAERARTMTGLGRVALSGGCFLNARLVERLVPQLEQRGFTVYRHREVSPGDGGVALGQAEVARQRLAAGTA
jgi:hydrogenase maturation protein HypF